MKISKAGVVIDISLNGVPTIEELPYYRDTSLIVANELYKNAKIDCNDVLESGDRIMAGLEYVYNGGKTDSRRSKLQESAFHKALTNPMLEARTADFKKSVESFKTLISGNKNKELATLCTNLADGYVKYVEAAIEAFKLYRDSLR